MKADFKAIILSERGYTDISQQLRDELNLKIDKLYSQNGLNHYFDTQATKFEDAAKNDLLCASLLSKAPKEFVLSGKLLQGIKTWFNMYYDDRLSVIDKFRTRYQSAASPENISETPAVMIAFCKFLISELLCVLVESRWQDIASHAD